MSLSCWSSTSDQLFSWFLEVVLVFSLEGILTFICGKHESEKILQQNLTDCFFSSQFSGADQQDKIGQLVRRYLDDHVSITNDVAFRQRKV